VSDLAKELELFMNSVLVNVMMAGEKEFRVKTCVGKGNLPCMAIFPSLPKSVNKVALIATFVDKLHSGMGEECPLDNLQCSVDWALLKSLKNSGGRPGGRLRETEEVKKSRFRSRRQQQILTSAECFKSVVGGPDHRIENVETGTMITYGGHLVRHWKETCARCPNEFGWCSRHEQMLKEWVDACDCYRDVWVDLFLQESEKIHCKAAGANTCTLVKTLDKLCTVIDNREGAADMTRLSDFLPAWAEGELLTSTAAVNVLHKTYKDARKTDIGVGVVMGGSMGCGKSWAWKTFLRKEAIDSNLLEKDRRLSAIIVVPRISLCAAVARELRDLLEGLSMEVVIYNEDDDSLSLTGTSYGERVVYVTVVNSIAKLCLSCVDIVIVDEIESIVGNLCGSLMDRENADTAFAVLEHIASRSLLTLCMDATMAKITPSLLIRQRNSTRTLRLCPRREEQQTLVLCKVKSPIFLIDENERDSDDFFNILCSVADSPHSKIAVCVGSIRTANAVRVLLRYNTDRSVLLVSGKETGEVCEQFAQCPRYDVTIFTPVVSVGMSESTGKFTHVFAYVEISPHTMELPQYIQMLARVRHVEFPNTYVGFSRPFAYHVQSAPYSFNPRLANVQMGKAMLSENWKRSGSKVTGDFIRMWRTNYFACQSGTTIEPCVVPYCYSSLQPHVRKHPGLISRPTRRDRARCRSKLMRTFKKGSTCMTKSDVNLIHYGACLSLASARSIEHAICDTYNLVHESPPPLQAADQVFFRPLHLMCQLDDGSPNVSAGSASVTRIMAAEPKKRGSDKCDDVDQILVDVRDHVKRKYGVIPSLETDCKRSNRQIYIGYQQVELLETALRISQEVDENWMDLMTN
jgi:hypothetical protein